MAITLDRKTVSALTLPEGKTVHFYWDDQLRGFGLKVRQDAGGKIRRSFVVQFRHGDYQRRRKIGDAAKLNADVARKKALAMLGKVAEGVDPVGEKQNAASKITLRAAIDQYIAMKEDEAREGGYRSIKFTKLYLLGAQYFASLHKLGVNEVTRAAVASRLAAIRSEVSDSTAGRARAQLNAFYVRMMQEGIAEANPVVGTKPQQERPERDRVLSEDELRAVWKACDPNTDFGRIVRLLILTGCRREEIGGLKRSEIDLDACTITLPPERTKNGRTHTLMLPPMAMEIIRSVPQLVDRDYLFGERSSTGFTLWQRCKPKLGDGCAPWRLHDLRRSVATHMAEIGIEPHIIEAALNHAGGHKAGVAGVYNRAKYAKQMKTALAMWCDHVAAIISDNVIAFPQSA
jgi:integrase